MKRKGCLIVGGVSLFFILCLGVFLVVLCSFFGKDKLSLSRAQIAVIEIKGTIMESEKITEVLKKVEKNKSLKAVVLRIDSPGGAVSPSQEIYAAVKRLKKEKKVVVSMGTVAASGGYYIACPADKILALPGTITGSIGVLMDYVNVQELLGWAKVHMEILKSGKLKDVGSSFKPLTEEDRAFLQALLVNMHEQFKKAVREGRGLSEEEINEIADGRVFSGEQALAVKLIDQMGGLRDAIEVAAELSGIEGEPKVSYPNRDKDSFFELLMKEDAKAFLLQFFYDLKQKKFMYLMEGSLL